MIAMRLATLTKIAALSNEPACSKGRTVDADRIFDGHYIPRRYKGYFLQVIERGGSGYAIRIFGGDGNPPRQTITFKQPSRALDEAYLIIDQTPSSSRANLYPATG